MTQDDRAARMPAYSIRADPRLIELAKLGLMLPATTSVSETVRAALQLAAGEPPPEGRDLPDGRRDRGGWERRKPRRTYVDKATMRVMERGSGR